MNIKKKRINRAKIEILEPIYSPAGTIYYAGFVNGVYHHFLSLDKMSKREIKSCLLKLYKEGRVLWSWVIILANMSQTIAN